MRKFDVIQRSPEWFQLRCGIPSASNLDKILTTTGKVSTQKTKYLYQLAGEAIAGEQEESYQNAAMLRGIELEAEARAFYELINDVKIGEVGFCIHDDIDFGASPDGLVGDDGLIEIKCPKLATHVAYLVDNILPTEYFQQVQGELFATDRLWADFISYYPAIKPFIIRVERDDQFMSSMKRELPIFNRELKEIIRKVQ